MAVNDRTEQQSVSTTQKLEATDDKGLQELNRSFDDAFGPREGATPEPPPPKEKPPKAQTAREPRTEAERAKPGHHAPVEVKRATEAPSDSERPLNLLGEPDYQPRPRDRKIIEFDEEIPDDPQGKKASAFPGRDSKSGKFTKSASRPTETQEEGEADETGETEETDPEVDAVSAKPNAHPDVKRGIQTLKQIAKSRRSEIKELLAERKKLETDLQAIRANGIPPDVKEELDRLRTTSKRFDLLNDPDFKARYENPVEAAGNRLLNFCVDLSGGDETIKKWAEETRKFGFKNLSSDYWDKEIIPKIASVTNQQRVAQLAADLHSKIDERNRVVTDFTASPDRLQAYQTQRAVEYYTNYAQEAQDESNKLVAQIGDWAQLKELDGAQTDEERGLFKEHNDRVEGYKTLFEKTMGDVMHGGPRKHVRVVAQAVFGIELDRQLKELRADYESLENDYQALRSQYNKVTRARSVPGRTGGGVDTKPAAKEGISTQDARSALREYFGGAGT